jgi:RNA polymerase sigma factor (sigma-70 family)
MRYGAPPQGRRRNLEGFPPYPKGDWMRRYIDMDNPRYMEAAGPFDARYLAFLETITQLRPRLHRYCSRMTGSVMDGEDVVQDALFEAYRKLDQYDDGRPLTPWLFRIAHNRCIDFLRRRGVRVDAETTAMKSNSVMPANPPVLGVSRAVEQLVMSLTAKRGDRFLLVLHRIADQLHNRRSQASHRTALPARTLFARRLHPLLDV